MLERDYIMRMLSIFAQALARILVRKQAHEFPEALLEIDAAGKALLGTDREVLHRFAPGQILRLFGTDPDVVLPKAYVAGALLKEECEIQELSGSPLDLNLLLTALDLVLTAFVESRGPLDEGHGAAVDQLLNRLSGFDLPRELSVKAATYLEMVGKYDRAENLWFDLIERGEDVSREAEEFYQRLLRKPDLELDRGNLPRNEVLEGLSKIRDLS